jgi:hypothetical protein
MVSLILLRVPMAGGSEIFGIVLGELDCFRVPMADDSEIFGVVLGELACFLLRFFEPFCSCEPICKLKLDNHISLHP